MIAAKRLVLLLFSICALYYSVIAYNGIRNYSLMTKTAKALSIVWTPDIVYDEEVYLQVHYEYSYGGHNDYNGEMRRVGPYFKNEWGAEKEAKKKNKEEWIVWLDPANPKNSTLIITFPLKELVYSLILWGLTLYFVILCRRWKP